MAEAVEPERSGCMVGCPAEGKQKTGKQADAPEVQETKGFSIIWPPLPLREKQQSGDKWLKSRGRYTAA